MRRKPPRPKRLHRFEIPVLAIGYATILYWLARGLVYILVYLEGTGA